MARLHEGCEGWDAVLAGRLWCLLLVFHLLLSMALLVVRFGISVDCGFDALWAVLLKLKTCSKCFALNDCFQSLYIRCIHLSVSCN